MTIVGDTTHLPVYNAQSYSCFLVAVSTFLGIADAQGIWASIVGGASAQTAVAALKLIARRVAGVISVGIMIYSVGECLNWWYSIPFNPQDTIGFGLPPVVRDTTLPLTLDTLTFP